MRNGINRRGLVFKIPLLTVHERETGTDDIVPNEHDLYLPFTLSQYRSLKAKIQFLSCLPSTHRSFFQGQTSKGLNLLT